MAGCFEYYADLADKLDKRQGQALQLPMEEFKGAIRRESLGVVGLITPWNYPMLMAAVGFSTAHAQCNADVTQHDHVTQPRWMLDQMWGLPVNARHYTCCKACRAFGSPT